jgi:AcrR family transcriptional regulator
MPAGPAPTSPGPSSPEEHLLRLLFHVRDLGTPDREGTRHQITAAAIELFTRLGYGGTSMRAIAAEVGIQAASIYTHFPDGKQQILHEGLRDIYNDFLQHVTMTLTPDMSRRRQLETLLERHVLWQLEAGATGPAWDAAYGGLGVHGVLNENQLREIAELHDLYHHYLESLFAVTCRDPGEAKTVGEAAVLLCDNAYRFTGNAAESAEQTARRIRDYALRIAEAEPVT